MMAILISVRCPMSFYLLSISITDSMDIEFEQTRGDGEGQGHLACCSPWGHKESDMTEQLTEQQTAITSTKGLEVLILPHLSSPNCLLTCMCVYSWVLSNSSSTQIAWWYIWNVSIWATKQPSHSTADVSFWKTLQDAWTAVKNYIWFEALNSDMDP